MIFSWFNFLVTIHKNQSNFKPEFWKNRVLATLKVTSKDDTFLASFNYFSVKEHKSWAASFPKAAMALSSRLLYSKWLKHLFLDCHCFCVYHVLGAFLFSFFKPFPYQPLQMQKPSDTSLLYFQIMTFLFKQCILL